MEPTQSHFNLLQYFPFLGFVAVLIPFWQQTRNFLLKVFRIFWKQRVIPENFAYLFYTELGKKSIIIDFDDYKLSDYDYFSLKHKKYLPIAIKLSSFEILLYKKFIPIFIFGTNNGTIKLQYLKFTFNFEKFLSKVVNLRYEEILEEDKIRKDKPDRFWIEEKRGLSLKSNKSDFDSPSKPTSLTSLSTSGTDKDSGNNSGYILEPYKIINRKINKTIGIDVNQVTISEPFSQKNKYQFTLTGKYVLSQVEKWLQARNWYDERSITWKRGMLLNGKPGAGKSSLVLQIARKVSIPLYVFDLSSMDNAEFDSSCNDLCSDSAIILFEDFDNVFNGRNNITKTQQFGGLTFDCFINKLSGVNTIKNKFIFITTNHLEKIDPAVIRPGRIDEVIDVLPINQEEKYNMAKIILNENNLINEAMNNSSELSSAEFENKCIQIALKNFWNNK